MLSQDKFYTRVYDKSEEFSYPIVNFLLLFACDDPSLAASDDVYLNSKAVISW